MSTLTDFEEDFSFAFYEGGGTSDQVPAVFNVAINGRGYSIDLSRDAGYQRTTLPLLRPSADQGEEVGEASLNTEGPWRRSASDWSHGGGQVAFDKAGSDRARFYTSKGVDPWNEGELTLLHGTELSESSTDTNLKLLAVGDYLFFVEGAVLKRLSGGVWTTITSVGLGSILSITSDGSYIYAADGSSIFRGLLGAAAVTSFSTQDADFVGYANGRLFAGDADVLYEISAAGTATALTGGDHTNPAFAWEGVAAAPNGVYFWGSAGNSSEVYYVGVNTATGALLPPVTATSLLVNERVYKLQYYGGIWILATSGGMRLGAANGTGIDYGELIETDHPVLDFVVDGVYAWYGLSYFDSVSSGIGRLAPGTATGDTLSAAYASDLMVDVQGEVQAVASFDGKRYFAISGSGVYVETDDCVETGWFNTGWITYGYTEHKTPIGIDLYTKPMVGSITVSIVTDTSTETAGSILTSNTTKDSVSTPRTPADRHQLIITLECDDSGNPPTLRAWVLKALPSGERIDEFIVPLIVADAVKVGTGEGSAKAYDPLAEVEYLKTLERTQEVCLYQEGASIYQVRVDRVRVRPTEWTTNHHFFNGLIVVRLLTVGSD